MLIIESVTKAQLTSPEKLILRFCGGLINVNTRWSIESTKRANTWSLHLEVSPPVLAIVRIPHSNGTCQWQAGCPWHSPYIPFKIFFSMAFFLRSVAWEESNWIWRGLDEQGQIKIWHGFITKCVQQSPSSHADVKVEVLLLLMFRAALPVLCQPLLLWLCLLCIFKCVFTTIKAHSFEKFRVWNSMLEKLMLIFNLLRSCLRAECP